jgi:hypothetical protein
MYPWRKPFIIQGEKWLKISIYPVTPLCALYAHIQKGSVKDREQGCQLGKGCVCFFSFNFQCVCFISLQWACMITLSLLLKKDSLSSNIIWPLYLTFYINLRFAFPLFPSKLLVPPGFCHMSRQLLGDGVSFCHANASRLPHPQSQEPPPSRCWVPFFGDNA